MIVVKTERELELMYRACQISAGALQVAGEAVKPGVSTAEIDDIAAAYIRKCGAQPNFLNYNGFPATACISINDEVIHGIPSKNRIIREGDIVSIDLGARIEGYNGDNAATFAAGRVSPEAQRLIDVTRECLQKAIDAAQNGDRIGNIGHAVQSHARQQGYGVVRDFTGHGIGTKLHEDPSVPNFGDRGRGARMVPGMTIAIEPMINQGDAAVRTQPDGWTVRTRDGKLSAHFEHTVAITARGPVVLTKL